MQIAVTAAHYVPFELQRHLKLPSFRLRSLIHAQIGLMRSCRKTAPILWRYSTSYAWTCTWPTLGPITHVPVYCEWEHPLFAHADSMGDSLVIIPEVAPCFCDDWHTLRYQELTMPSYFRDLDVSDEHVKVLNIASDIGHGRAAFGNSKLIDDLKVVFEHWP